MENKNKYFKALIENNGQLNEIDLGEQLSLNENETSKIISQLLSEHKIGYFKNRFCNYSPMKIAKRKNKSR